MDSPCWYGHGISGLVVEYIVAIDVTWVRFPADALLICLVVQLPAPQIRLLLTVIVSQGALHCGSGPCSPFVVQDRANS